VHEKWKILAPVDLGSEAEARVQHALNVAAAVQGDLTLLYVLDGRATRAEPVEWPANAMVDQRNCKVRRVVLVGSVAETVGRYAGDLGADLVTVTAGSFRWWNRFWKRSAATGIAAVTDVPVCITRLSSPALPTAFRSILCVVALDGTDEPLVRFSEEVAQRCDATLVLLHVIPEVSEALIAHGIPGVDDRPLSREVAEQRFRELTARLSRPHLTAITTEPAYRSIANAAREHKADVVITALDAESVLSRVSCPVMSIPVGYADPWSSRVASRVHLTTCHDYRTRRIPGPGSCTDSRNAVQAPAPPN
jgi:nucleotide-binding universal stress UspA family protein